jgi:hypothetical protein
MQGVERAVHQRIVLPHRQIPQDKRTIEKDADGCQDDPEQQMSAEC